jgi:PKD repeat protein
MRMLRTFVAIAASLSVAGCTLKDGEGPSPTGPSEFALSVVLSATPDQLPRDGSSQSVITITVRDDASRPVGGQRLNVSSSLGALSATDVVTNSSGQAALTLTAPDPGTVGNTALISVIPVGTNAGNAVPRTLSVLFTGTSNTTRPNPVFNWTPTNPEVNAAVRFDASLTSDEGAACFDACSYHWDFGDGSTATGRVVTHTFTAARTYTVTLNVTDAAGTSASIAHSVVVAPVPAPSVTLSVSPNPPLANQRATFTATATAATGHSITSYSWDFGDGTTQTSTTPTVTKTYSNRGLYIVTVTVTDDVGQTGTALLQFTISGAGVTASFTSSPAGPLTGQPVQFNGSASAGSAGSTITEWAWDFGDGGTSIETGPTTSHTYGTPGNYIVRLTVTDSGGRTGTTTGQVSVTAP